MQDVAIPSSKMRDLIKLVKTSFPNKTVLFDFWNESCNPCVFQHKILQKIEESTDNNIVIYRVDVAEEENYNFAKENNITTLPTLIIFKKNKPFSLIGLTQIEDIKYFLNNDPNLCINCKKLNLKKSNRPEHYYCKKYKIYVYFKDSC
jgi:thioredoxin-like negative regulator of GroEL